MVLAAVLNMESLYFIFLLIFPAVISAGSIKHLHQNAVCGPSKLSMPYGVIMSPNYPQMYPNFTSCSWIIVTPPRTVLTISITDLDIEEDVSCDLPPCCRHTWLSLPAEGGNGQSQQFCGRKIKLGPIIVQQENTYIKFHTSKVVKGGRGFHLKFKTDSSPSCASGLVGCGPDERQCFDNATQRCDGVRDCLNGWDETSCGHGCFPDEMMCLSGDGCYRAPQKCDGKRDCDDFSDEADCDFCGIGQALCSSTDGRCFSPRLEQCNGKFDCPLGEDELGCSKECVELACGDGSGCYSRWQRCDGAAHCRDGSDEAGCLSDSGGLGSAVITAAVAGSLLVGLLLVVALGCVCRMYGLRVTTTRYQMHSDALQRVTRAALRSDEEFFHREPPPAYSVAVPDAQQLHRLAPQSRMFSEPLCRSSHRSRSARRGRRRSQRLPPPPPPPPAAAGVGETSLEDKMSSSSSSATDSPSRGSVTSSTSAGDDVPLIIV